MAEVDAIEIAMPPTPPVTILVIEDDSRVARMLSETLQIEGYITLLAATGEEGVDLAARESPELILLDLMLPGMDGFQVVERIRGAARTAHIPVVVVSARHDANDILRAFGSHVDDYLTKPFHGGELIARIRTQLRHSRENSLSSLTSLPAGMRVERAIEDRLASTETWSILYLDLDTFKAYNDVYGFLRGNKLIQLLARIASETTHSIGGPGDFVGHVGGDDFIITTTPAHVAPLCERIIARWDSESREFYSAEDLARGAFTATDRRGLRQSFPLVSLSIGVVTNERRPVTSLAEVSRIAAEVKRVAKGMPGSAWFADQRAAGG